MCIFETDTVKSDSPVQIFRKEDLIQTVGLLYSLPPLISTMTPDGICWYCSASRLELFHGL